MSLANADVVVVANSIIADGVVVTPERVSDDDDRVIDVVAVSEPACDTVDVGDGVIVLSEPVCVVAEVDVVLEGQCSARRHCRTSKPSTLGFVARLRHTVRSNELNARSGVHKASCALSGTPLLPSRSTQVAGTSAHKTSLGAIEGIEGDELMKGDEVLAGSDVVVASVVVVVNSELNVGLLVVVIADSELGVGLLVVVIVADSELDVGLLVVNAADSEVDVGLLVAIVADSELDVELLVVVLADSGPGVGSVVAVVSSPSTFDVVVPELGPARELWNDKSEEALASVSDEALDDVSDEVVVAGEPRLDVVELVVSSDGEDVVVKYELDRIVEEAESSELAALLVWSRDVELVDVAWALRVVLDPELDD